MRGCLIVAAALLAGAAASLAANAQDMRPWMNPALSPDQRAVLLESQMTLAERIALVHGLFAFPQNGRMPPGALGSAGYVPAIPRLGIPALEETDASLGVANPFQVRPADRATALPSSLATAASFDPKAAYDGGAMIGQEARRQGFNVLLAGGANLTRDPRNGRNFEYLGEDPLLAGLLDGEAVRGIQDQHVISTVKHFVINDQETNRNWANSVIDEAALRESDLLAFELAIERGHPGAVMCSYNLVNGAYACGNNAMLNGALKTDWGYSGWVMSDWGAVHDVGYAAAGLDQESAAQADTRMYFDAPLRNAIQAGAIPASRLSDMVRRILRSMFAVGVFDYPPMRSPIDFKADAEVTRRVADEGIVLLKNDSSVLPLSQSVKRLAIIGGYAENGVMSGGGSSQVIPPGSFLTIPLGGEGSTAMYRNEILDPSPPLAAIRARANGIEVRFDEGRYLSAATALAKWADVAVVFANQWMTEGADAPDLSLPDRQDQLIAAVAAVNPKTVVVLETGGPVVMPWLDSVSSVLEAWYPGSQGGEAIADVLFGADSPSGHLPITFPMDAGQNPRPQIPGLEVASGVEFNVPYTEGSDAGYRWFAKEDLKPLFPFGFGLSYTSFAFANLAVSGGSPLTVSFDVTNRGSFAGAAVPQVYLTRMAGESTERLIGFSRIMLAVGQTGRVSVTVDPRLLANFDTGTHSWRIAPGTYEITVGRSASEPEMSQSVQLDGASIRP